MSDYGPRNRFGWTLPDVDGLSAVDVEAVAHDQPIVASASPTVHGGTSREYTRAARPQVDLGVLPPEDRLDRVLSAVSPSRAANRLAGHEKRAAANVRNAIRLQIAAQLISQDDVEPSDLLRVATLDEAPAAGAFERAAREDPVEQTVGRTLRAILKKALVGATSIIAVWTFYLQRANPSDAAPACAPQTKTTPDNELLVGLPTHEPSASSPSTSSCAVARARATRVLIRGEHRGRYRQSSRLVHGVPARMSRIRGPHGERLPRDRHYVRTYTPGWTRRGGAVAGSA